MTIKIKLPGAIDPAPDASINLQIRQTLDGNLLINDHQFIDILIVQAPPRTPSPSSLALAPGASASSGPPSPRQGAGGPDPWLVVDAEEGRVWLGRVRIGGRPILVDRVAGHSGPAQPPCSGSDEDVGAQPANPWHDLDTAQDAPSRGARARSRSGGARTPSPRGPN